MIIAADRVVGPTDAAPGWVRITGERIAEVGDGHPPRPPGYQADLLLPGFLDLHMHGGGGHDAGASAGDLAAAVAFHHRHGTAATLVSLVTAPIETLSEQLARVAAATRSTGPGRVLGAHLEGPFLSAVRCGAQHPDHLRDPDPGVLRDLLAAAAGTLRTMTIAPELPGALAVIEQLRAAGVIVAIGHTDATYAQTRAALDAGASLITHLFNGMRPLHHREPGPVLAALERRVPCELINDGVHVHPALVHAVDAVTPAILITDAMSAAGEPDGRYQLGGQPVEVRDGVARLGASGSLAGSTLTMAAAVARAVRGGIALQRVAAAAASTPARVLGVEREYGLIAAGRRADLVALDAAGSVRAIIAGGAITDLAG